MRAQFPLVKRIAAKITSTSLWALVSGKKETSLQSLDTGNFSLIAKEILWNRFDSIIIEITKALICIAVLFADESHCYTVRFVACWGFQRCTCRNKQASATQGFGLVTCHDACLSSQWSLLLQLTGLLVWLLSYYTVQVNLLVLLRNEEFVVN